MTKVKEILSNKEVQGWLSTGILVASFCGITYGMCFFGAREAIKKTRFEIHLFDSEGKLIGYAD